VPLARQVAAATKTLDSWWKEVIESVAKPDL